MKKSNCREQKPGKKERSGCFSRAYVFEARKMWASSECLNPYNAEYAYEQMNEYFSKGGGL